MARRSPSTRFRNTLIPVVTVSGIILSLLIGGSVVVEQVFALPGIGRLIVQGILARDYPLVQGTMLIFGFAFVLINILRRHHLHAGRSAGALWLTSTRHIAAPDAAAAIRSSAFACCASSPRHRSFRIGFVIIADHGAGGDARRR